MLEARGETCQIINKHGTGMAAERDLFLDIDREPERERARPAGAPGFKRNGTSSLWPALSSASASRDPRHLSAAPLGMVPVDAPRPESPFASLAGAPTPQLSPQEASDLAASLAALKPASSTSRPITLADALAALPAATLAPQPAPPEPPAVPLSAPEDQSPADLTQPPGNWRAPDGVYHVRVPVAEVPTIPLPGRVSEADGDEYLARSYDFTRPAIARLYDQMVVPLWSVPFGRMLLSAFQSVPRQPGWQVVDVACGTGYPTLELAQLLGPDGDVAGVDVWGAGLEVARAKAARLRLANVAFLAADVAACDLPEGVFDLAACNLGLTNFAHPGEALKGIARLLQPNGTLILTTNLHGTMHEFFETYRHVLDDLGLLDLSWDVERVMHMQPTVERVEALLDMAGFTVDQTFSDHFALEFPDGSTFLRSPVVGMGFLHTWRNVVRDLALRRVVFNEIERRLNDRAAAWGRLDLMVPMLCVTARRRTEE